MSLNDQNNTESIKRKAYALGLSLKNTELDREVIYAKLEKQGIPEEIIIKVIDDVILQRKKDESGDSKSFYQMALIKTGIGVGIALISTILFPDEIILPIGFILGGITSALIAKKKMKY